MCSVPFGFKGKSQRYVLTIEQSPRRLTNLYSLPLSPAVDANTDIHVSFLSTREKENNGPLPISRKRSTASSWPRPTIFPLVLFLGSIEQVPLPAPLAIKFSTATYEEARNWSWERVPSAVKQPSENDTCGGPDIKYLILHLGNSYCPGPIYFVFIIFSIDIVQQDDIQDDIHIFLPVQSDCNLRGGNEIFQLLDAGPVRHCINSTQQTTVTSKLVA